MSSQDLVVLAIQAMLQFLENNDMTETAETLAVESGIEYDRSVLSMLSHNSDDENVLLAALQSLIDKNQKKSEPLVEEKLAFLRTENAACTTEAASSYFDTNVLACEFLPLRLHDVIAPSSPAPSSSSSTKPDTVYSLTATFDKKLRTLKTCLSSGLVQDLQEFSCPSPVLSIDVHPSLPVVALGCMGGEVVVAEVKEGGRLEAIKTEKLSHTFIYGVRFDQTGGMLGAVSRDGRLVTYFVKNSENGISVAQAGDFSSGGSPLAIEFLAPSSLKSAADLPENTEVLCVARNGANHLALLCPLTGRVLGKLPLNGEDFDLGVSFNVLSLRRLPPQRLQEAGEKRELLLVGTDQSRILLLSPPNPEHVRSYYNLNSGLLTVVVARWSHDGAFVVTNAFERGQMAVFDAPSARLAHRVEAHSQVLRCVACHPDVPVWITGSFDKSVKFWTE